MIFKSFILKRAGTTESLAVVVEKCLQLYTPAFRILPKKTASVRDVWANQVLDDLKATINNSLDLQLIDFGDFISDPVILFTKIESPNITMSRLRMLACNFPNITDAIYMQITVDSGTKAATHNNPDNCSQNKPITEIDSTASSALVASSHALFSSVIWNLQTSRTKCYYAIDARKLTFVALVGETINHVLE